MPRARARARKAATHLSNAALLPCARAVVLTEATAPASMGSNARRDGKRVPLLIAPIPAIVVSQAPILPPFLSALRSSSVLGALDVRAIRRHHHDLGSSAHKGRNHGANPVRQHRRLVRG